MSEDSETGEEQESSVSQTYLMDEDLRETRELAEALLGEVEKVVMGKRPVLELVMTGILAGGNILFEDNPGLAKTLLANTFAPPTSMISRMRDRGARRQSEAAAARRPRKRACWPIGRACPLLRTMAQSNDGTYPEILWPASFRINGASQFGQLNASRDGGMLLRGHTVSFTGMLTDELGNPLNGNVSAQLDMHDLTVAALGDGSYRANGTVPAHYRLNHTLTFAWLGDEFHTGASGSLEVTVYVATDRKSTRLNSVTSLSRMPSSA